MVLNHIVSKEVLLIQRTLSDHNIVGKLNMFEITLDFWEFTDGQTEGINLGIIR